MFEFLERDFPNTYYTDHIARLILSSFPYYILLILLVNNFHVKHFRRFVQNENFLTVKNSRIAVNAGVQ